MLSPQPKEHGLDSWTQMEVASSRFKLLMRGQTVHYMATSKWAADHHSNMVPSKTIGTGHGVGPLLCCFLGRHSTTWSLSSVTRSIYKHIHTKYNIYNVVSAQSKYIGNINSMDSTVPKWVCTVLSILFIFKFIPKVFSVVGVRARASWVPPHQSWQTLTKLGHYHYETGLGPLSSSKW